MLQIGLLAATPALITTPLVFQIDPRTSSGDEFHLSRGQPIYWYRYPSSSPKCVAPYQSLDILRFLVKTDDFTELSNVTVALLITSRFWHPRERKIVTEVTLQATNLVKRYNDDFSLGPVSMTLAGGQTVGVLGKNGAGKTTLFQMLTGNLDATKGEVRLAGQRLTPDTPELKRHLGYLPQHQQLPPWVTGRELLIYCCRLHGISNVREKVAAVEQQWDCEFLLS